MSPVRAGRTDRSRLPAAAELAAIGLTIATNVVANTVLPVEAYVPANLASAGLITWFATHSGATREDFGLRRGSMPEGTREGLKLSVPIVGAVVAVAAVPFARRFFADEQVVGGGTGAVLYETFLRIPLGTALAEEMIFRGALLGMFRRRYSRFGAVAMSSGLFGLWHVLPTLRQLQASTVEGGSTPLGRAGIVASAVAATTVAGFGFAWLRDRKDSIATPVVSHAAINTAAYLSGRYLVRLLG